VLSQADHIFVTARDCEGNDHPIAPLKVGHSFSGFLNNSHEFVAQNVALFHGWDETVKKMQVRSTNSGAGDFHNGIVRVQDRRIVDGVHLDLVASHPTQRFHNQAPVLALKSENNFG
jgi:hypothetical protein